MEILEVKILLKNLYNRLTVQEDGSYVLDGKLTTDEVEALKLAPGFLDGKAIVQPEKVSQSVPAPSPSATPTSVPAQPVPRPIPTPPEPPVIPDEEEVDKTPDAGTKEPAKREKRLDIDSSALDLPAPPENIRLCLDFGTAMSKATLVEDGEDIYEDEKITVLNLGEYGDEQEDYKLTSAVYIDDEGKLWFGKEAEEYCASDSPDGERQVMDNIKHWLSLGQVDSVVDGKFNPTGIEAKYSDVILAYLTFLTWSVNKALENLEQPPGGYPRNLNRRFAMPCLSGHEFKEVEYRLRKYLGEAQILADTFFSDLREGLPLDRFMKAVELVRKKGRREYRFIREGITEPLGVAGSLLSYASENSHHMVVMVVDIGAGTTDFSVYRMYIDPEKDISLAVEAENGSGGVTNAGNHLDSTLMGLIFKKLNLGTDNEITGRVQWAIQRNIREYKETLFDQESVWVSLPDGLETEVTLDEFLDSPGVKDFEESLAAKMKQILEHIHKSWIDLIEYGKVPYLTVALTGGGASLPMAKKLAEGEIEVNGACIRLAQALSFPGWLKESHAELELDYPRIAVSLGGARQKLIQQGGVTGPTAGGAGGTPVYDDPKYQW